MKIPINLASQPFRRDRALILASGAVSVVLLATLGILIRLGMQDSAQIADVKHEVNGLNSQITRMTAEQSKLDAVLREPANADVLYRTVFINSILMRKGISWTRILADLEKVLPYNVKIVQIRPSVNSQDEISLDMQLASDTPLPVIDLLKRLGQSTLFQHPDLKVGQPPTQAEPLYRYTLSVDYAQSL